MTLLLADHQQVALSDELADLIECHEDEKVLRWWQENLERRLRLAYLKTALLAADPREHDELAIEIGDFRLVTERFAAARQGGMR